MPGSCRAGLAGVGSSAAGMTASPCPDLQATSITAPTTRAHQRMLRIIVRPAWAITLLPFTVRVSPMLGFVRPRVHVTDGHELAPPLGNR